MPSISGFLVPVLCFATFIVNCQADDQGFPPGHFMHGDVKPDVEKCRKESGISDDEFKVMMDDKDDELTAKQACFAKCIAESVGFLKDGVIDIDLIKKNVPSSVKAEVVNTMIKCMENAGKVTKCEDISKLVKCIPGPPKE